MIKDLMYIELKTGYSDDGPAWIGYVKTSKTKKTIYFNDHAFQKYNGDYSNYVDIENGDEYWISGLKKKESNRHWDGHGKIIAAVIRDGRIIACDRVEALSKTSAKRVTVHGIVNLEHLHGVRARKMSEHTVSFLYRGDMERLLRTLSSGRVDDLAITEPDLEEIICIFCFPK